MEELIDVSKTLLRNADQKDLSKLAKILADWALPGDRYNEQEGRFERSGLSIDPFVDLIVMAETINTTRSEETYELCA